MNNSMCYRPSLLGAACVLLLSASAIAASPPLTLNEAIQQALTYHPLLTARSDAVNAQQALSDQASAWPNPVLSWGRQNLNNDRLSGTDGPADTVMLTQTIELGGKRGARMDTAAQTRLLREQELQQTRADIVAETRRRFTDAVVAQAQWTLGNELLSVAEKTAQAASEKVRAGKVAPIEQTKANISLTALRAEQMQSERERDAALARLLLLWGNSPPKSKDDSSADIAIDSTALTINVDLPAVETLQQQLQSSPYWQRSLAVLAQREAELDLSRAKAYPDLALMLGRTTFSDLDEKSDQVGLSLSLPLFDRNQGDKADALMRRNEARAEQQLTQAEALVSLRDLHRYLSNAQQQLRTMQAEVLPAADDVYRATLAAYHAGKLGLLEVLDAQRTLSSLQHQQLLSLQQFHYHVAQLEQLLGHSLNVLSTK